MKYIALPYINTFGTKKFKEFLLKPFTFDDIPKYFYGWKKKEMVNWFKFSFENHVIETQSEHYQLLDNKTGDKYKMPHPITLNDFINDMYRLNVTLLWGGWINDEFKPKDFLGESEIVNYYRDLLKKLNKEHELIYNEGDEHERRGI